MDMEGGVGSRVCTTLLVLVVVGMMMTPPLLGWKLHQIRNRIKIYKESLGSYNTTYAVHHAVNLIMCQDRLGGAYQFRYVGGNRTLANQFIESVKYMYASSAECNCQQVIDVYGPNGKIAELYDNAVDCTRPDAWMELTHPAWYREYDSSSVSVSVKDPTATVYDLEAQAESFVVGLAVVSVIIGIVTLTMIRHLCCCMSSESWKATLVSYPAAIEPADSITLNVKTIACPK